jgi:hypothetical protein
MPGAILWLLLLLGLIGAFDTLYYHEWRARLPAMGRTAAPELKLHAIRDFLYVPLFATLPFVEWRGWLAGILAILLLSEIVVTVRDFIVEDWVRRPLGGVFAGERATHALMGIAYGALLAYLIPTMLLWWEQRTSFVPHDPPLSTGLVSMLALLGLGVALSGVRDLIAAHQLPNRAWPWRSWTKT